MIDYDDPLPVTVPAPNQGQDTILWENSQNSMASAREEEEEPSLRPYEHENIFSREGQELNYGKRGGDSNLSARPCKRFKIEGGVFSIIDPQVSGDDTPLLETLSPAASDLSRSQSPTRGQNSEESIASESDSSSMEKMHQKERKPRKKHKKHLQSTAKEKELARTLWNHPLKPTCENIAKLLPRTFTPRTIRKWIPDSDKTSTYRTRVTGKENLKKLQAVVENYLKENN